MTSLDLALLGVVALLALGLGLSRGFRSPATAWACDLGTTNTVLARWDAAAGRPVVLELTPLARRATRSGAECLSRGVPSAVHVLNLPTQRRLARRGPTALIGQPALDANYLQARRNFAPTFKRALALQPLMPLASSAARSFTARETAQLFLKELLAEAQRTTGERVRELVITSPVDAFETYRAELTLIGKRLGLRKLRFIDEPVAAALGYGLSMGRDRTVLVVDFGGGTLDVAVVRLSAAEAQQGRAEVVAKSARDIGGNLVDEWILQAFSEKLGRPLEEVRGDEADLWRRLLRAEACRVKEAVFFDGSATFETSVPETRTRFEQRLNGTASSLDFTREDLSRLLTERGVYRLLGGCVDEALAQAAGRGISHADLDDVLMVGGSTLLPGVFGIFEERFGRDRVRAWQPFEAVASGAAVFASGQVAPRDFIVHDYALQTFDPQTGAREHVVVVPRGTRFPTEAPVWKRQLVPTCGLGAPEEVFKLLICELGSAGGAAGFSWDAEGKLHRLDGKQSQLVVVPLNEASPAMGRLRPPHPPHDRAPRLEVSFAVNAERWLCSTVVDLRSGKRLMRDEPVVKLL